MVFSRPSTKSRVEIWAETVARETAATQVNDVLSPISANPRRGKRKAVFEPLRINPKRGCKRAKVMAENEVEISNWHTEERRGRGRGRPPGRLRGQGRGRGQAKTADIAAVAPPVAFDPPSLADSSLADSTLPSRPGSPKKRGKDVNNPRSDAGIDMKYLESCRPSIKLRSHQEARQHGPLPQMVVDLYKRLNETPDGFIPARLKPNYDAEADTPRKTRDPPLQKHYSAQESWIPTGVFQSLKSTVDRVVKMAARNYRTGAHERQWSGTTVLPLIHEVLKWAPNEDAVCLNVETCSIEPVQLRMARPNGSPFDDGTRTTTSKGITNATDDEDVTTSRMIDLALGLDLNDTDADAVTNAFKGMRDNEHSLNQSMAYIRNTPLFLDIELKKVVSNRDPDVQLAIWQAASYSKKLYHGWDTSMPMPGIVVNGHDWQYYITFERDGGLIMMGPVPFGSTKSINGVYEIAYKLNILAQWGITDYGPWFKKHILGWCREGHIE